MTILDVAAKAAHMAEIDPHGWTITIVSVGVVFCALLILFGAYSLTGAICSRKGWRKSRKVENAVVDEPEGNGEVHDIEPYTITIRRRTAVPAFAETVRKETPEKTAVGPKATEQLSTGTGCVVTTPLPGVILSVDVAVGDRISAGQRVAVLEAMKMENDIEAEKGGTVTAVHVRKGDSLPEGAKIVTVS